MSAPKRRVRDEVVLVTSNDWHLTDLPPASRVDNYVDEVFGLLDNLAKVVIKVEADALCVAGDIFHTKDRPMGAALLTRLIDWCRALPCPVLMVPGNHDMRYDRPATIPAQPLGVLLSAESMRDVSVQPWFCRHVSVMGVGWPTAARLEDWPSGPMDPLIRRVVLAHCFANRYGGDFFGQRVHRYEDIAARLEAVAYVFGHDHSHVMPPVDLVARGPDISQFINLGALCRIGTGKDDLTRDIRCAILTIPREGAAMVRQIQLPSAPADKLFDLDKKAAMDEDRQRIADYVMQLEETLSALDSQLPIAAHLSMMTVSDEVRARMERYLADVEVAS